MSDSKCCCCGDPLGEHSELIPITLEIPDEEVRAVAAVVCGMCALDFENAPDVVEVLINARVIRLKYPEKEFTPRRGSDSGPGNEPT